MLDLRVIYAQTEKGATELRDRARKLANGSRRILRLIDGRRATGDLTLLARPGELEPIIEALLTEGLIQPSRILDAPSEQEAREQERRQRERLASLQRALAGLLEQELGVDGLVLDARIQDCVNLEVLRRVLRDVIDTLGRRAGDEAMQRTLARVRQVFAAHIQFDQH
jgi:hypothetical protein